MRNIYDIISEHKSLVDFNISCYELAYVAEEFEFVQEGFVDGIKNIVKKVIDFIKKIITKIKETINKAIDFLFGRKKGNSSSSSSNSSNSTNKTSGSGNSGNNNDSKELTPEEEKQLKEKSDKAKQNMWNTFTNAVDNYKGGRYSDERETVVVYLNLAAYASAEQLKKYYKYINSNNSSIWEDHKDIGSIPPRDEWDEDYQGLVQSDLSENLSKERVKHLIEVVSYTERGGNKKSNAKNSTESTNKDNNEVSKNRSPEEILKNSKLRVTTFIPTPLQKKIDLANKFFSSADSVVKQMSSMKVYDKEVGVKTIIERTFKDRSKFKDQLVSGKGFMGMEDLEYLFNLNIDDEKQEITVSVSSIADKLIPYLNGDKSIKYLRDKEKSVTDNLNKLIRLIENAGRQKNTMSANDYDINDLGTAAREISSLTANFVQIICKSIVRCSSLATQILEKAKNEK